MRILASATFVVLALALVSKTTTAADPSAATPTTTSWPFPITAAQRPGTYLWCPGSAFTKADIDFNLQQLHDAGFGFVHVIPIYGAKDADDKAIPYLSSRWVEMFDYLVKQAKQRGMFVDMTTGTGWCFGGPDLPTDAIDVRARYDAKTGKLSLAPAMKVKRAAPGGEGPMLNPFSPRAMEVYLERFTRAFDVDKMATPRAQYHDSFEYQSDWTADLYSEFLKRNGYDLKDHLPLFFNAQPPAESIDELTRLKHDYRHTLSELHRSSIASWTEWSNSRGMLTRNQAHGSPSNLLDTYAAADIPETEMFGAPEFPIPGFHRDPQMVRPGDSDPRVCMLASSAAHVAHAPGRQLVTSESCTWLREHWHETLPQIKLELDLFFLAGVNQMLFHGTCFSPQDAPWPGWYFYAATQMNWRNSIWADVPVLTQYVARCQSVLQAGQPANDVLVYWPISDLWMNPKGMTISCNVHHHDWLAKQRFGEVAQVLMDKGFAFDFVSDRMLKSLAVADRIISAPGGKYRAILIPACRYMPTSTLQRLAELREQGATIIFEKSLPEDVPGMLSLDQRRAEFAAAKTRLEKAGATIAADVVAGLETAGIQRERMADQGLRFIRRRDGKATWYFIANHTARDFDGWLPISTSSPGEATFLDPMTGELGHASQGGTTNHPKVYLQLPAGATLILHLAAKPLKPATWMTWSYWEPTGTPQALSGKWSVEFIRGGPELPAAYSLTELAPWTAAPDKRAQAFAGTAKYTLRFTAPTDAGWDWLLDLGDVRDSARVRLNGQEVGSLIALPFQIRVGPFLKPGENLLEVEVTNVSANRVRDMSLQGFAWKTMKDANIVNVDYKKWDPSQWPIEPAGLLGPVRLIPRNAKPLRR